MGKGSKTTAGRVRKRTRPAVVLSRPAAGASRKNTPEVDDLLEAKLARLEANAAELEARIEKMRAQLARRNGRQLA